MDYDFAMSNPYAPEPQSSSPQGTLPPGAGERIVIEPDGEIVSKIGTIDNGDYYYDQNDDQPIPLDADRIVVLMGGMDRRCRAVRFRAFPIHAFCEDDEGRTPGGDQSRTSSDLVGDAGG